jgi:hypothetical protein
MAGAGVTGLVVESGGVAVFLLDDRFLPGLIFHVKQFMLESQSL